MAKFFAIHPENPQTRLIQQSTDVLSNGGVVAFPTDSGYALGCVLENKRGLDIIRQIRRLDDKHNFVCAEIYRKFQCMRGLRIKNIDLNPPAGCTFILEATREVPRRLLHPKRKQIGIRIPDNRIALSLLEHVGEPLMTSTLMLPGEDLPMTDPYDINEVLGHQLDLVIDGGFCGFEGTTVIDLTKQIPLITRHGAGDTSAFSELA